MTTTSGQLKKARKELQQFRREYLSAVTPEEKRALEYRIKARKILIEQLGGGHVARAIWLTESQLGDLIWDGLFERFAGRPDSKAFREFPVGYGRVDFAAFHKKTVNLYELKITASIDSVIQLAKYSRDMSEHLRRHFYSGSIEFAKECPEVKTCLIARYFDTKIVELCTEYGIGMLRVNVVSKSDIELEDEIVADFPEVPISGKTQEEIQNFYGVVNV
ncbi:MAG: hypothetical protein AAGB31_08780 [Bdellovibrio sp.]